MKDNSWYEKGELPPICEVACIDFDTDEELNVKVLAYNTFNAYGYCAVCERLGGDVHNPIEIVPAKPEKFRPIQSERDKLIEQLIKDMVERLPKEEPISRKMTAQAIVDAGWRPTDESSR